MSTRKSVRYKLPVNVFIDGHHCPVIDFSRTGAGLIKNEFDAKVNAEVEIIIVFPHKSGNEGWGVKCEIVRVDENKNFFAVDFVEDENFRKFFNEFIEYLRSENKLEMLKTR